MHPACHGLTDTAAFVMAGGIGERLRPLTDRVPKPLLPFGGVFRLLDFTLSNCSHSGVSVAGVLSQYQSGQIGDHLRRVWKPGSGQLPIVHLPPTSGKRYRGTADAVRQNLFLAVGRGSRYALVVSADHIYQADYRDLVRFHKDSGAEVTVSVTRVPACNARQFGVVQVDQMSTITSFEEKPSHPRPLLDDPEPALVSMGVYVFNIDALADALVSDIGKFMMDLGNHVLPSLIHRRRVVAWEFQSAGGATSYWRDLGTLESYHEAHMDFLDGRDGRGLLSSRWPVAAADAPIPGAMESPDRIRSLLRSSAPEESRIEGSFKRSVLSPGVRIGERADVRDSILMHDVRIGSDAKVYRAIVERGVHIPPGEHIGLDLHADRSRFHVTDSGLVVIDSQTRFLRRGSLERMGTRSHPASSPLSMPR